MTVELRRSFVQLNGALAPAVMEPGNGPPGTGDAPILA